MVKWLIRLHSSPAPFFDSQNQAALKIRIKGTIVTSACIATHSGLFKHRDVNLRYSVRFSLNRILLINESDGKFVREAESFTGGESIRSRISFSARWSSLWSLSAASESSSTAIIVLITVRVSRLVSIAVIDSTDSALSDSSQSLITRLHGVSASRLPPRAPSRLPNRQAGEPEKQTALA